MDLEEIKTLTEFMIANDLSEIMIRDGDKRIVLRRGMTARQMYAIPPLAPPHLQAASAAPLAVKPAPGGASTPPEDTNLLKILSPMVGTYYAAPDPQSPPFVQVGDEVKPDSVVCVIEAMKVFNEIKAEVSGIIESINVENGKPVEFGQILMTVRPA